MKGTECLRRVKKIVAGGGGLIDRGDPSTYDFSVGDLTIDGAWHDLDLSSIVPAGTTLVCLRVIVQDDLTDKNIKFRKKGNSNSINMAVCKTVIANVQAWYDVWVAVDSSRVIEYSAFSTTWTAILIAVAAY